MKLWKYRHYKGKEYRVLWVARYTIDLEKMVVYQWLYDSQEFGNEPLWVRPLSEFEEVVPYEGKKVERFSFVWE
jgi:hypothetical protein